MTEQWSNSNRLNSFNSMKGLTYFEHYKKILMWMDGKGELPPPFECNLDPYAECNLACQFCLVQRYLINHREEVGEQRVLTTEYMYRLIEFLSAWGVKGFCLSGGGEPTLHKGLPQVIDYAVANGLETSLFTNGTIMNEYLADSMLKCRFVSLSINATDRETYKEIMCRDLFDHMRKNLAYLAKRQRDEKAKVFTCVRMLILSENYKQIYDMCKWAKEIGLSAFNVRPVDLERSDIQGHHKLELPIDFIQEQFAKCHELEDDTFKVFTVTEKYDSNFHVKMDFNYCLATPLLIPILQNCDAFACVDRKMEYKFRLGSCNPPENILKWWGSDEHRNFIKSIKPERDCCNLRCTFSQYNKQIFEVVLRDSMMRNFP